MFLKMARTTFSAANKPARTDSASDSLYARVYAQVRRIPRGRVSTYGRIARLAGGCGARQVGYAMAALPPGSSVPWQRVINHKGEISTRKHGDGAGSQRRHLEAEGIRFDPKGRVNLKRYGWPAS